VQKKNDETPGGMDDDHEPDKNADRPPEQVEDPVLEKNPFFAVDRARSTLHSFGFPREGAQLDLLSVYPGSTPPFGLRRLWRRMVGHAVAPDTADEMIVPDDEALDHRAGGVISVGDEVERVGYL